MPEMDLGGGFGIAYTTQDDPCGPGAAGHRDDQDRRARVPGPGDHASRGSRIEPGRAIVGPAMCTVYDVGTVKEVALDGGHRRTYVSVDGGMSDNIRTALYDADYSATLASRASAAPAVAGPGRGQALRGRRHRGQGRVPARRRAARRPPGRARDGRLLPVDGLQLQPRAASSGDRSAGREDFTVVLRARLRTICWQPTWVPHERAQRGNVRALKVAVLGCGAVGSQVVRLLTEQARRPGGPGRCSRRAGRRRRTPARRAARDRGPRRPADHRCGRAGRPRRRRPGGRGDRRHRARPVADPHRAGERRERRHGQQGAPRRGRARRSSRRRRRPSATSTTRPRSPARSRSCGRCASRWPATRSPACSASSTAPPTSSSTRWTPPVPASPRRSRRPRSSATPRPTRPPTSRASTPPPRPRSWPAWPSTPA